MVETNQISEEELKANARKTSVQEGAIYSVSEGFGFRNITPYALAIGANNFHIGLINSIPTLIGNLAQLISAKLTGKYSRKNIVVLSSFLQAFIWLAMLIPGVLYFYFNPTNPILSSPNVLIFIYTFLILFGASAGPAWSSWMKDLVSSRESRKYFGHRNRIAGTVALISMLIAGFVLDYFKDTKIFIAFIILFSFSFIARAISAYLLTKKYEPHLKHEKEHHFSFFSFIKKMHSNNFGRFVIFVSLISLATSIAAPFFAVYMLKNLGFESITLGYFFYFTITLSSSLASLLFMPMWGNFADKYGNFKIMKMTGLFIPMIPLLWVFSVFLKETLLFLIIFLFIVEAISGLFWGGFNLSTGNFIYDAVTREKMAQCIAYFNVINSIGVFIGAMLGGILASLNINFYFISPLIFIFLVSGVARFIVYFSLSKKITEVRGEVEEFNHKGLTSLFKLRRLAFSDTILNKINKPRG